MKIKRKIERTITVSAQTIYEALAAKYDLPTGGDARFEEDYGPATIDLVVTDYVEQELGA